MTVRFTSGMLIVAALWSAAAPVRAQQKESLPAPEPTLAKEQLHEHMRLIGNEIAQLRDNHGSSTRIAELIAQYEAISSWLGGDQPVRLAGARGTTAAHAAPQSSVGLLSPPACNGAATTTVNFTGTSGPILAPLPSVPSTFTVNVSGVGTFLWDLNLNTNITHPNCADLDIKLQSPAGTIVTITTDNGGAFDNVFGGTTWDDNVNDGAVDHVYTNLVAATPLTPEGRLEAFRGEDPNGTWTLTVADDATTNIGTLNSWSLDLATTGGAPATTTSTISNTPALAIPDNTPAGVTDTIVMGGLGSFTTKVTLYMEIPHTFPGDLDITLQSPAGTIVPVTTDNGGTNDNAFNGTLFDGDVLDTVTDHVYAVGVVVPLLSPEGAFDNFLGQDPNGGWTLKIVDDAGVDVGTLVRWDLSVTAAAAPVALAPSSVAGTGGPINDFGAAVPQPSVFTATVSGVASSLWDVDLTTLITHTSSADIDMTLTSPAGTVVTISTDNGGTLDNVFNGTLWDDNANDGAVDHVYTNLVAATPLSPEGRLSNFRCEDPNGVWTLTIVDDALADNGTMNSWSLDVTTGPPWPSEVATTFTSSPALAIPDNTPAGVTDIIAVSSLGTYLTEVELYLEVPHTFPSDLDITLQSPAGTIVQVTTDNGGTNDNAFNGTLFDADITDTVTDHVYAVGVVVPLLSPEGSFDNFRGQDPNGNWTLKVVDDLGIDVGTLVRWDLTVRTCAVTPAISFCGNGDPLRVPCPCGNNGTDPAAGCSNSLNAAGALITASGSVVADNVVLDSTGMSGTISIFFRTLGPSQINGVQFGDGITCTGGPLLRLRAVAFAGGIAGVASFPVPPETVTLSARSGTFPGSGASMQYSSFYRNAAAAFCPPFTFNTANTIEITW